MASTTRATSVDRLFGRQPEPAPIAPPDDPNVLDAAEALGIPTDEITAVRTVEQGTVVQTADGIAYLIADPGTLDALLQPGGGRDGNVYVWDPQGTAPRLQLPRWTSAKELNASPWGGASFAEVAEQALAISVPLQELRDGEQVIKWVDGDPVKAAAFWAASARAADLPAPSAARANPMAGWCRQLIIRSGIVGAP